MITGSKEYYLSDPAVKNVVELYEEGCQRCFHRKPKLSGAILRSIQGFVAEYGDEAPDIIETAFLAPYNGLYRGVPMGSNLFSSKFRWMQEQIADTAASNAAMPKMNLRSLI